MDPNRSRRNTRNGHRPTERRNAAKLARRREKRARAKAERGRRKARDSMPTTAASERRRNPLEVDRMREPHHTGTDLRNRRLHRDRRDCSQPRRAVHTTAEPGPTAIDRGLGHQTGRRGRRAGRHHQHTGGTRSERRAAARRRRARRRHREERPRARTRGAGMGPAERPAHDDDRLASPLRRNRTSSSEARRPRVRVRQNHPGNRERTRHPEITETVLRRHARLVPETPRRRTASGDRSRAPAPAPNHLLQADGRAWRTADQHPGMRGTDDQQR